MTTKAKTSTSTPPSPNGELPPFIREDPPGYPPRKWARLLAPLAAMPGDWYRIYTGPLKQARATSHNLTQYSTLPGRYEFASRKLDATTGGVWARYLGPNENPS